VGEGGRLAVCVLIWLVHIKDDHYTVFRFDIRQDRKFATGYEYPKTAFKPEPDTDPDIQNAFISISRIQTFGKSCTLHNHSFIILTNIQLSVHCHWWLYISLSEYNPRGPSGLIAWPLVIYTLYKWFTIDNKTDSYTFCGWHCIIHLWKQ